MWKFQDFSITQILCEINYRDSKSAKSAFLTHLEALNFDFYEYLHWKAATYQINKIQHPKTGKNNNFRPSRFSKIDFTENLSDRKILKFPHCVIPMLDIVLLSKESITLLFCRLMMEDSIFFLSHSCPRKKSKFLFFFIFQVSNGLNNYRHPSHHRTHQTTM